MKDNFKGIGIWGMRHYRYLKENKPTVINVMRMRNTLYDYLMSVDETAEKMMYETVIKIAKQEGITEELKRRDQMAWGAGVRWTPLPEAEALTEATEIINKDIIFT